MSVPAAFRRILTAAALAGLLAGVLLTGLQHVQVVPAILQAEQFEQPEVTHEATHVHDGHEHDHGEGWAPEDGMERTAFTALSNITMAVGFALLLGAAISMRAPAQQGWRAGLLWGAAGYAVFFLAPSLGLPPELPGTEAAPLPNRQAWWLLTVGTTAAGLGLLAFGRDWKRKLPGLALLVLPFVLGAPQPEVHASTSPQELVRSFIVSTTAVNAVFWLVLGALTAHFYKRAA